LSVTGSSSGTIASRSYEQELRADFESLDLPGMTRLELRNNEYGIKYWGLRHLYGHMATIPNLLFHQLFHNWGIPTKF